MDKKALSESDICAKCITPAVIQAGWDEATQIRREVSFTKGRIIVRGKLVTRGKPRTHIARRHSGRLLLRSLDGALPQAHERTRPSDAARRTLRADPVPKRLHHRTSSAGLGPRR
jgi:hypothetical protein